MSTEENIHLITGDISAPDKDLGQEKAKSGMDIPDQTKQNVPATIQNIQEEQRSQRPQEQKDGGQTTSDGCKGQKDPSPAVLEPTKLQKGQVEKSVSKPFKEQDPAKDQEKCRISTTIPADNKEIIFDSKIASNLTGKVKRQGDGQKIATNPTGGLEKHEDGKESESSKDVPQQESGHVPLIPTDESKREGNNEAEDVKKQERRRWFHFPRSSKNVESQTNEQQNAKTEVKKKGEHEEKSMSNGCGRYLLAIAVIIACVLFILSGFFWRIGYAMRSYHEDLSNATACPTLHPPSNDRKAMHTSVLKALQRMWRNKTNELGFD